MRTNISFIYSIEEVDTIIDRVWNWKYLKAHQKITPKQVVATGLASWAEIRDYVTERWGLEMTPTGQKMRTNKLYQKVHKFRREFAPDSDTVWRTNSGSSYNALGFVVSASSVGAKNSAFTIYGWSLAGVDDKLSADNLSAEWVGVGGWEEARKRNVDIAADMQMRISRYEREIAQTQKNIEMYRNRVAALLTVGDQMEAREPEEG